MALRASGGLLGSRQRMTAASMLRLVLALLLIGSGNPSTWRSINAVTLAALDLEAAIAFYTSLGLENSFVTERFATMSAPLASMAITRYFRRSAHPRIAS